MLYGLSTFHPKVAIVTTGSFDMDGIFDYLTNEDIISVPYYYHVTLLDRAAEILKTGLDPNERDEKEKTPRIFLYANPAFISAAIQLKCPMGYELVTILRIASENLLGKKLSLDDGDEYTLSLVKNNIGRDSVMARGGSIICYEMIVPEFIENRGNFEGKNRIDLIRGQFDISVFK